jgi:anion-transporting  ArsA/GET3 family ATPase
MTENTQIPKSSQIPDTQLLIITGKGGVGKTAVATALAAASARRGQRTLLTIYEREDIVHPLLGTPVGYDPVLAETNLWVSRLESQLSMKEYIHRNIPFHLLYDWLLNGKILGQFTDAAPGFDEVMCLGKLYDLADGSLGKAEFDTIVFDAPATGHSALMLRAPSVIASTVGSGPIHQAAMMVKSLLEDHQRCSVLMVTLAEEMAIQEGTELLDYVDQDLGLNTGPMIVNRTRVKRFSDREIELLQQNFPHNSAQLQAVIHSAVAQHRLSTLQAGYIAELRQKLPRLIEVPQVIQSRFDSATIIDGMAAALEQAMAGSKS